MKSYLSNKQVKKLNLLFVGGNVFISRKASFYNNDKIRIGSNVRIDDYCIISGRVAIGNNVHISAGTYLFGGNEGIRIGNNVNISSRCGIYAVSDDFINEKFIGPMSGKKDRLLIEKKVVINDFCAVGTSCTILPGTIMEEGSCLGAMSFLKDEILKPWLIYAGIPCKVIGKKYENNCHD